MSVCVHACAGVSYNPVLSLFRAKLGRTNLSISRPCAGRRPTSDNGETANGETCQWMGSDYIFRRGNKHQVVSNPNSVGDGVYKH